jgi:hypothetical protein
MESKICQGNSNIVERLGFPKTSEASFWGSQQSEERAHELAAAILWDNALVAPSATGDAVETSLFLFL